MKFWKRRFIERPKISDIKNMVEVSVSLPDRQVELGLNPLDYKFQLYKTKLRKIPNENGFYYVNYYAVLFGLEMSVEKMVESLADDLLKVNGIMDFTITF